MTYYDDVFSECLIILYKSIERYKDSKYGFYPFFLKNLNNRLITLIKYYRKNSFEVINNDDLILSETINYFKDLEEENILSILNEEERQIIYLKFIEKRTANYISNIVHMDQSQVFYSIKKSISKIKKAYFRDK